MCIASLECDYYGYLVYIACSIILIFCFSFTMDSNRFYGCKNKTRPVEIRPLPMDSDDSELESDNDDEYIQPTATTDDDSDHEHSSAGNQESDEENEDDVSNVASTSTAQPRTAKRSTDRISWSTGHIATNVQFSGDTTLDATLMNLKTPMQFFHTLFTESLEEHIVEQSNLFSVQSRPDKPLNVDQSELQQFIGVCMWMSLIKLPSARKYWTPLYKVDRVSEVIGNKRYEEIKRFLHFEDNLSSDEVKKDKLWKMRPMLNKINEAMKTIPREESLCVDEQIVPFKGRIGIKQYNPRKPHRWGYKLFVLSGVSGFAYDIEVFTGKENVINVNEVDCGASSNVVVRLTRTVVEDVGHQVYFDNYFTSLKLMCELKKRGIYGIGTVRLNRVTGLPTLTEKEMKKTGRGTVKEFVTTVDGTQISCVRWYDNKVVSLLSTFVGVEPLAKVKRWSSRDKATIEIDCPQVIRVYNEHMGGVDLLDSLLGLYRIHIRSKKWYHRIFFHLVDLCVVNSWILYRRVCNQKDSGTTALCLCDYKAHLAEALCKVNKPCKAGRKRPGRPSIAGQLKVKVPRQRVQPVPDNDMRSDGVGHWPSFTTARMRCRVPLCNGISRVRCNKCQVHLCLSNTKNCFTDYHTS